MTKELYNELEALQFLQTNPDQYRIDLLNIYRKKFGDENAESLFRTFSSDRYFEITEDNTVFQQKVRRAGTIKDLKIYNISNIGKKHLKYLNDKRESFETDLKTKIFYYKYRRWPFIFSALALLASLIAILISLLK